MPFSLFLFWLCFCILTRLVIFFFASVILCCSRNCFPSSLSLSMVCVCDLHLLLILLVLRYIQYILHSFRVCCLFACLSHLSLSRCTRVCADVSIGIFLSAYIKLFVPVISRASFAAVDKPPFSWHFSRTGCCDHNAFLRFIFFFFHFSLRFVILPSCELLTTHRYVLRRTPSKTLYYPSPLIMTTTVIKGLTSLWTILLSIVTRCSQIRTPHLCH